MLQKQKANVKQNIQKRKILNEVINKPKNKPTCPEYFTKKQQENFKETRQC